jgi:hypothetical protein
VQYWAVQSANEMTPTAILAMGDDNLPRRFVPGMGLVDWPAAASWTSWGEPGAHEISVEAARAYMHAGVGTVTADVVNRMRGTAPTLPVPGVKTRPLSTTKHFVSARPGKITRADAEKMAGDLFDAIATERARVARGE